MLGLKLSHQYSDFGNPITHLFMPELSIGFHTSSYLFAEIYLPFVIRFRNTDFIPEKYAFACGDPNASLAYQFSLGNNVIAIGANYSYPLGLWNSYQTGDYGIISGSGYHKLGVFLNWNRIWDPGAFLIGFEYRISLPRGEQFGWSMIPGELTLNTGWMHIENETVGVKLVFQNKIILPTINTGSLNWNNIQYSIFGEISLFIHIGNSDWIMCVGKELSSILSGIVIGVEWISEYDI